MIVNNLQVLGNDKELLSKIKEVLHVFQFNNEADVILSKLSNTLGSSLFLVDLEGKIIAHDLYEPCNKCSLLREKDISLQSILLNASNQMLEHCPFTDEHCIHECFNRVKVFPLWRAEQLVGHFIFVTSPRLPAQQLALLAEVIIIFLGYIFADIIGKNSMETEESKKKLKLALGTLTHTEKKIIFNILQRFDGSGDSLIVKINSVAKEFNVAPSVINRGLKKLQSAGIIRQRSLSPKGTFISITNKYLMENLDIFVAKEMSVQNSK